MNKVKINIKINIKIKKQKQKQKIKKFHEKSKKIFGNFVEIFI